MTTRTVSLLVSWFFEPSQPQRITSGLNTNFTLSPSHSFHKSSYHKSCLLSLFIFRGRSTRKPTSGRMTYFILRAYTGTGVSHSQHRKKQNKTGEVLEKMQVNGPEGRNKQGRNPWQKALHVWLYTNLLQVLKGERLRSVSVSYTHLTLPTRRTV